MSRWKLIGCTMMILTPLLFCGVPFIYFIAPERPKPDDFTVQTNTIEVTAESCELNDEGWCRVEGRDDRHSIKSDITGAALYAFAYNRVENIQPYFGQGLWGFLDSWADNHEALSEQCQFAGEPLNGPFGGGGKDTYSLQILYYGCPNGTYDRIEVELTFRQVGNQIVVASVDSYCESFEGNETCWTP